MKGIHGLARLGFLSVVAALVACGGGSSTNGGGSSSGSGSSSGGGSSAVVITKQPSPVSAPVYQSATFTVAATGSGTLTYQWYEESTIPGPDTALTGATSATLTFSSVTPVNSGTYYCIVSNASSKVTSNRVALTVLTERSSVTLTGEIAVLPGSTGHVISTPMQSGVTYSWTIANGTITSGQNANQVTYTAGSLGHTTLTLTVLTSTGVAIATQNVAVVASVPIVSVFAQSSVLPGSSGILASAPSFPGQTYAWTLTAGTASGSITTGQTSAVLTYSVGASTGAYQLSLSLEDLLGHQGSDSETLSVVSNTFVPDPRDPGPRSLHTATLLNDGRVLIAGGDAGIPDFSGTTIGTPIAATQSVILASAELYDVTTNTFALVGSMSTPRFEHSATLLNDGRVLVAGGSNSSSTALATTEIYDPATRSWTAGPSLMTARALHTATLLSDGRVLVAGGVNTLGAVDTGEIYDAVANTWSAAGTMTAARVLDSATLLPNGQVLVVGGRNGSGLLASTELYNPTTNGWTASTPLPSTENGDPTVLLLSGQVLEPGEGVLYDPATAVWSSAAPAASLAGLNSAVYGANAVLLNDGRVFVSGGFFGLSGGGIYDPVSMTFAAAPGPNPANNSYSTATLLPNGDVLTLGGVQTNSGVVVTQYYVALATAAVVDPTAGTVAVVSSGAHDGSLAANAVLPNGNVLYSGGFIARYAPYTADVTTTSDLYDPGTNTWTSVGALNTGRGAHTATTLASGAVLAAGGYNDQGSVFTSAELYSAQTAMWTSAGAMANPRYQHTASLLGNGTVLVAGGSNAIIGTCTCTTFLAAAELYNPTLNTWSSTGSLATARYGHSATVLPNGSVLVAGGFGGPPNTLQNIGAALQSAELYDPGSGTWSAAAPMNVARFYHTATLLSSGMVLVVGGDTGSTQTTSAEVYDPTANTWSIVGSLAAARMLHSAVLLPSGDVLVVGGFNSSASAVFGLGSAEVYDPIAQTFGPAGSMTTLRQGFTLSLLNTGRVMLVGGLPVVAGTPEFYQEH
jgi:N-acetylneuraminic acid mutarotase